MPGVPIAGSGGRITDAMLDAIGVPASQGLQSPLANGVPVNAGQTPQGGNLPENYGTTPGPFDPQNPSINIPVANIPGISIPVSGVVGGNSGSGRSTTGSAEANKIIINIANESSNENAASGGSSVASNAQGLASDSGNVGGGSMLWIMIIAVAAIVAVVIFRK